MRERVAEGHATKEIPTQLGIGTKTTETSRATIMEKRDIHDTVGLVRYAIRRGMIQP